MEAKSETRAGLPKYAWAILGAYSLAMGCLGQYMPFWIFIVCSVIGAGLFSFGYRTIERRLSRKVSKTSVQAR